jgi:gluconolactonase
MPTAGEPRAIDPPSSRSTRRFEKYWIKPPALVTGDGLPLSRGPRLRRRRRYLLWATSNNRILKWEEETEAPNQRHQALSFANGSPATAGPLVTCLLAPGRGAHRYDGSITTIADSFDGKRLNSPNDVVVKSDGSIWFTDPVFGILADYEGYKATPEIDANVYRWDPDTKKLSIAAEGVLGPNGLCFSPDEKILYIVESRGVPNRKFLAYDVTDGGKKLANKRVHIDAGPGTPDGMRCDIDGNLWCGWGMGDPELDGVVVFAPDGVMIGRIALPDAAPTYASAVEAQPPHGASQSVCAPINGRAPRRRAGHET